MVRALVRFGALVPAALLAACTASGLTLPPKATAPAATSAPGAAPNAAAALQQLGELTVAPRGPLSGYSREKYPHWSNQGQRCDTREVVLERDGTNVRTNAECSPTSGTWQSRYDGQTWTKASDVDIDHMVPLAQSWVSGARSWTQQRREEFANDLTRPQLFAVTDNVNQEKSDKAPDEWKPPLVAFWCTYATDWITVKHYYQLTVTEAEKSALSGMLDRC